MFHAQTYDGCLPFTKITRVKILNAGKHSISKSAEHINLRAIFRENRESQDTRQKIKFFIL